MSKIVNLSEGSSIAIHGMILIARTNKPLNVDQIAERTNSSRHHVAKIMQRLSKAGFLNSIRGPSGGFYLTKDLHQIDLLSIYQAIEGEPGNGKCPMNKPVCSFDSCIYENIIGKMTDDFVKYLKSKNLSEFV